VSSVVENHFPAFYAEILVISLSITFRIKECSS
jgi:hypothetical protein